MLFEPSSKRQRGVVLVIVLAFVVLLSGLVVAYFSRAANNRQLSNSSFNQARADELARSALSLITSDLKQEIAAGSTSTTTGKTTIHIPTSGTFAAPIRTQPAVIGTLTGVSGSYSLSTLLRISSTNAFAIAGTNIGCPASNASSTGASANGRSVTPARWNQHYLIPCANTGTPTDSTPVSFTAPNWIYVTGPGPAVLTAPTNSVIGRYAYAIYDEGALLDVNVAGYPLVPGTPLPKQFGDKGSLAYADLTVLGITGTTGVNNLVGWRNYASLAPTVSGSLAGNFSFTAASGTHYAHFITSNTTGFLKVSGVSVGGRTDQAFLSRQQLLSFSRATSGSILPMTALPLLGTFSRAVNAPSWKPSATLGTPPGNTIDYAGQADTAGSVNRNLANVRSPGGTLTHWSDGVISSSGTMASPPASATYTLDAGEPLLQSRFSLAKIAWLSEAHSDTGAAPSAAYAQAIQACFGLVWDYPGAGAGAATTANGGNKCWNYVGSNGGATPQETIETLDAVAQEGREPNFFELLKAAILNGSLGKGPGPAAFGNGASRHPALLDGTGSYDVCQAGQDGAAADLVGAAGLYGHTLQDGVTPAPARIPDMQIIQIGANIIDQYDADSYPTAIYFKYSQVGTCDPANPNGVGNPRYGPVTLVYGDENLPYLTRLLTVCCSPTRTGTGAATDAADNATNTMGCWLQPELWNPHQQPTSALPGFPLNYQIRAYGAARTFWSWNMTPDAITGLYGSHAYCLGQSNSVNYYTTNNPTTESCTAGTINFTLSSSTTASLYAHPVPLTSDTGSGITGTSPSSMNIAQAHYPYYDDNGQYTGTTNHFVAFSAGVTPTGSGSQPFFVPSTSGIAGRVGMNAVDTAGLGEANTYALGWLDSSSNFHPYSYITGAMGIAYNDLYTGTVHYKDSRIGSVQPDYTKSYMWLLPDPRTGRFAPCFQFNQCTPYLGNSVFPNLSATGASWSLSCLPGDAGFSPATGTGYPGNWAINTSNAGNYYSDPDGVIRPGDGVYSNAATGDGVMLFSSTATPTGGNANNPYASVGDSGGNTQHGRRPVILNRPFRSVGELGYVFRDLPFKTLDFFTQSSADAALLDVFSIKDEARIVDGQINAVSAGQVNLNNAPVPVIQALLAGGTKKEIDPAYVLTGTATTSSGTSQAKALAKSMVSALASTPILNRADLVVQWTGTGGPGSLRAAFINSPDKGNKAYLEAPIRALSDVANTRTWNLFVDVIAQTGIFPNTAPQNPAALNASFFVQGERRYWLHIAIDRYTGKVIDQQLEAVYE